MPDERKLVVSHWPHIRSNVTISSIMYDVVIALIPPGLAAWYFFGLRGLYVIVLSVIFTLIFEWLFIWMRTGKPILQIARMNLLRDGSALVTGLLLAYNLPATSPWWLILIGALVAMGLGKHVYGGLGSNPFNPALLARVFLLVAFPSYLSHWIAPVNNLFSTEAITQATPLGALQVEGVAATKTWTYWQLFIGAKGGSIGETSVLAILIGAAYLFWKGHINWRIPIPYILTVFVITGIAWLINPKAYADPVFHLLTGGLALGAFFMATDMVTSPITPLGQIIFGIGCGLLTAVIRLWGSYPEGVSFSILIMNIFVPLINKYTIPRKFGDPKWAEAINRKAGLPAQS